MYAFAVHFTRFPGRTRNEYLPQAPHKRFCPKNLWSNAPTRDRMSNIVCDCCLCALGSPPLAEPITPISVQCTQTHTHALISFEVTQLHSLSAHSALPSISRTRAIRRDATIMHTVHWANMRISAALPRQINTHVYLCISLCNTLYALYAHHFTTHNPPCDCVHSMHGWMIYVCVMCISRLYIYTI